MWMTTERYVNLCGYVEIKPSDFTYLLQRKK